MGTETSITAQNKCNNRTLSKKRRDSYVYYNHGGGIEENEDRIIIHHQNRSHSVNPQRVISYALNKVNPRQKNLVWGYMRQFRSTMNEFRPKQAITKVFGFMCFNQYETLSHMNGSNHNRQCFHNIRLLVLLYFHERETLIDDDKNRDRERENAFNKTEIEKDCKVVEDLYDEIYDDLLAIVMAASRSPSPMPPVSSIKDPSLITNSPSRDTSLNTPKYSMSDNNHLISPRTQLVQKYEAQVQMKVDNDKGFALRNDEWWVSPEYSPEFPDPQQLEFQQS